MHRHGFGQRHPARVGAEDGAGLVGAAKGDGCDQLVLLGDAELFADGGGEQENHALGDAVVAAGVQGEQEVFCVGSLIEGGADAVAQGRDEQQRGVF